MLRARPRPSSEPGISTSENTTRNLWGSFEYPQRFVGIARLQNLEASLGEKARARDAQQGLVLDDQDGMAGFWWFYFHSLAIRGSDMSSFGFPDA
jgi:hypothetical protein